MFCGKRYCGGVIENRTDRAVSGSSRDSRMTVVCTAADAEEDITCADQTRIPPRCGTGKGEQRRIGETEKVGISQRIKQICYRHVRNTLSLFCMGF